MQNGTEVTWIKDSICRESVCLCSQSDKEESNFQYQIRERLEFDVKIVFLVIHIGWLIHCPGNYTGWIMSKLVWKYSISNLIYSRSPFQPGLFYDSIFGDSYLTQNNSSIAFNFTVLCLHLPPPDNLYFHSNHYWALLDSLKG